MMLTSGTLLSGNFSLPCVAQSLHTNFIYSSVRTPPDNRQNADTTLFPDAKAQTWAVGTAVCGTRSTLSCTSRPEHSAIFPSLQTQSCRSEAAGSPCHSPVQSGSCARSLFPQTAQTSRQERQSFHPSLGATYTHNHTHLASTENSLSRGLCIFSQLRWVRSHRWISCWLCVVLGHPHLLGKLSTSSRSPTLHPSPALRLCRSPPSPGIGKLCSPDAFSAC